MVGAQTEHLLEPLQQPHEVERPLVERRLPRLDLREREHVVDEREQVLAAAGDDAEPLALRPRERRVALQELDEAEDAVERRPQLVRHVGEKDALRAARLHGRLALGDEVALEARDLELVLDAREHLVGLERLGDVVGAAALEGAHLVDGAVVDAEEDDRHAPRRGVLLQPNADLVAVHLRHVDVEHDEVRRRRGRGRQGTAAAPGHSDVVVMSFEDVDEQIQVPRRVVDDQDHSGAHSDSQGLVRARAYHATGRVPTGLPSRASSPAIRARRE